jgi:hypothetical protein
VFLTYAVTKQSQGHSSHAPSRNGKWFFSRELRVTVPAQPLDDTILKADIPGGFSYGGPTYLSDSGLESFASAAGLRDLSKWPRITGALQAMRTTKMCRLDRRFT